MAKKERRKFKLQSRVIFDLIFNQAGTLHKAIMEGVMNSVDAKATQCHITIEPTQITITDNGGGIPTREEIERFFETFGEAHSAEEEKVFGRFRIGRGQLFKYGVNVWETGPFRMTVDAKNDGLDYDLEEFEKPIYDGCKIVVTLYDELLPSDLSEAVRTVTQWCKYAPLNITVNGETVTVDPAKEKWDHVLPEAYINLKTSGSLSIYNLGVHTMEIPGYRFGTGGTIVSRKALGVNFARNDVQDTCPVWRVIKPFVAKKANELIARKKRALTDDERQRIIDQVVSREYPAADANLVDLKIFTMVNGRYFSIYELERYSNGHRVTVCDRGNVLGDKLHQRKLAAVLASETLEQFGVSSVTNLLDLFRYHKAANRYVSYIKSVKFEQLTRGMDTHYTLVPEAKYTPNEQLWMDLILYAKSRLVLHAGGVTTLEYINRSAGRQHQRKVIVGIGPADGWTDGETYVAINRAYLSSLDFTVPSFCKLGNLLLHEFCHAEPSSETHVHTPEFYQLFHDSCDSVADFVDRCMRVFPDTVKRFQRKMTKKSLRDQDRQTLLARAKKEITAV